MDSIPSPFNIKGIKDFDREVAALCKKYDYPYYFTMIGEPIDKMRSSWSSVGNIMCEGLVEALEENIEFIRKQVEEHGQGNP